ncbi:nuclease-related domain-containing protein [Heyndrickxia oleronia]|uniref:Nuclease-related domain-containing protein n=1 Tax=Heyndrickxia oleronia TaxID=38875 RepID=A0AAW6T1A8_9BACI|nr:nuclease-related domain-containing protein [Heyndrickxia oleronia]MDH5163107.1 nuclease-related domain-containing protein [Heyndrickxia oleronia]
MIVKELTIPYKILMDIALLRRLRPTHPKLAMIEEDLTRRKVGYRGEQNLLYHLGFLPPQNQKIFFGLRLPFEDKTFQIDTLILTPSFILIIEVKNYSGILLFEKHSDQLIRIYQNKEEAFPNPIFQVQRHHILFDRFLKHYNIPNVPIEHIVIISHSTTQIKTSSDNLNIYEKVLHSEKIISKMAELHQRHKQNKLKNHHLQKVSQILLEQHKPEVPNSNKIFDIYKDEIIKGVCCPVCRGFKMARKHGKWVCSTCYTSSKEVHKQTILDYLLLIEPSITNKSCQDFLNLSNPILVHRLLSSMKLPSEGNDGGKKYLLPPPAYFQEHYGF